MSLIVASNIAQSETHMVDACHDLLCTIGGALDVRDVFQGLSAAVARIIPHDEAHLVVRSDDQAEFRLYASTTEGEREQPLIQRRLTFRDPSTARLFDGRLCNEHECRSGLHVPMRVDGQLIGVFVLLSRSECAYSERDLFFAQRVADYVAMALSHYRLAEVAQRAAIERDRAANLETSVELLRAIAGVLDIRTVFPRVSEIANNVLPHDRMTMSFDNGTREIAVQACSNDDVTYANRITWHDHSNHGGKGAFIVDDLQRQPLPIAEPCDLHDRIVAAGYRSLLAVNTSTHDQDLVIEFWSKRVNAFSHDDVPAARRIADHVALAVSHEQLAEAAREVAEARTRADHLESRVRSLAGELEVRPGPGRAVGHSSAWKDVLRKVAQVAPLETTVLLTGESGTGKEVVARLIHRASTRKNGPFIAINCAALPEALLESELFGYERGAFTGAQVSKPGQLELAAGGVLFLDELSEMSLSAQAKVLRVLQEREFQRLGGTRLQKANVRVIAASNRDLRKAVERGDFREDLYYRVQVFEMHIPPLRERREDILVLSDAFLQDLGKSVGRPSAGLTKDAKTALLQYEWPGNVRELRNVLERAVIVSEGALITAQHLSLQPIQRLQPSATSDLNVVERQTIEQVMRETHWNKTKAARRLGLSRTQLYVRLRRYDLDRPACA